MLTYVHVRSAEVPRGRLYPCFLCSSCSVLFKFLVYSHLGRSELLEKGCFAGFNIFIESFFFKVPPQGGAREEVRGYFQEENLIFAVFFYSVF